MVGGVERWFSWYCERRLCTVYCLLDAAGRDVARRAVTDAVTSLEACRVACNILLVFVVS